MLATYTYKKMFILMFNNLNRFGMGRPTCVQREDRCANNEVNISWPALSIEFRDKLVKNTVVRDERDTFQFLAFDSFAYKMFQLFEIRSCTLTIQTAGIFKFMKLIFKS